MKKFKMILASTLVMFAIGFTNAQEAAKIKPVTSVAKKNAVVHKKAVAPVSTAQPGKPASSSEIKPIESKNIRSEKAGGVAKSLKMEKASQKKVMQKTPSQK